MKRFLSLCLLLGIVLLFTGCQSEELKEEKIEDLEYTIVPESDIPEEFFPMIEEKKQNPFKLSFKDKDALYIGVGYGEQKSTGYSIGVENLYLTENAIYFDTTLIGPVQGEKVTETKTYPYLVVKLQRREEAIVFD